MTRKPEQPDDDVDDDDPTDPSHPDFDLSEASNSYIDRDDKPWFTQRWVLLIVAFLVITGLLLPYFLRL